MADSRANAIALLKADHLAQFAAAGVPAPETRSFVGAESAPGAPVDGAR